MRIRFYLGALPHMLGKVAARLGSARREVFELVVAAASLVEGRLMVVGHTRASCRTSARLYSLKGVVPSERKCDPNVSSSWSECGTKRAAIGAPHGYDHGSHHYSCRSVAWRRRLVRSRSLVWPLISSNYKGLSTRPGLTDEHPPRVGFFRPDFVSSLFRILISRKSKIRAPGCSLVP
jgi:hypothetical protein